MQRVALVLLLSPLVCAAQDYGTLYNNGHVSVWPERVSTGYTTTGNSTGVNATKPVTIGAPGGRSAGTTMSLQLSRRGVATIAARAVSTLAWPLAVGSAAWMLYDEFRVRPWSQQGGAGGQSLARDPGQAEQTLAQYKAEWNDQEFWGGSVTAAGMASIAAQESAFKSGTMPIGGYWSNRGGQYCDSTQCVGNTWRRCYADATFAECTNSAYSINTAQANVTLVQRTACPGWTDPLGMTSRSFGYSTKSPDDNKCPTGAYTTTVSPEEAALIAASKELTSTLDYKALLDEALGRGPALVPPLTAVEVGNTIPSVVGPVVTTTNADGTQTEVATGWDWARDEEKKSQGRWVEEVTTTQKDAQGVPIGAPVTVGGADPAPEARDPCEGNPTRLGCMVAGDVQAEPDFPTRDIVATADPDSGWGDFSAACPAPRTFDLNGQTIEIDNTLLCDFLGGVRWIVLAFASLAGIRIVLGGLEF